METFLIANTDSHAVGLTLGTGVFFMSISTHQLECRVSQTLWKAIEAECKRTGDSVAHVVERTLANELTYEKMIDACLD